MSAVRPMIMTVAVTGAGVLAMVVLGPVMAVLGAAVFVLGLVAVQRPFIPGVVLAVSGPLLFSSFTVGPVTLDNLVTAGGGLLLVVALGQSSAVRVSPVGWYLIALLVMVALSVAANPGSAKALSISRFAVLVLLALAIVAAVPRDRDRAVRAMYWCLSIGAVSLVLQPVTGFPDPFSAREGDLSGFRYGGLFGHPNFAAYPLSMGLLYLMATPGFGGRHRVPLAVLLGGSLLMTGSRGALATLAILVVLIAGRLQSRLAYALIVVGAVALPFATVTLARFANVLQGGAAGTGANPNAGEWRLDQWKVALRLWREEPWLGVGWQNAENLLPGSLGVHNSYLQVLVETGVLGSLVFVAGFVVLLRRAFLGTPEGFVILYLMLVGLTDPGLLYPSTLVLLAVMGGVVGARDSAGGVSPPAPEERPRRTSLQPASLNGDRSR